MWYLPSSGFKFAAIPDAFAIIPSVFQHAFVCVCSKVFFSHLFSLKSTEFAKSWIQVSPP